MNEIDYSPFWTEALNQLEQELGEHEFSIWFNIEYAGASPNTIRVRVPSSFYRDQFIKAYQKTFEAKLADLTGKPLSLEYLVEKKPVRCSKAFLF